MLQNDRRSSVAQTCRCLFLLAATMLGYGQVGVKTNGKDSDGVASCTSIDKKVRAIVVMRLGVDQKEVTAKKRFVEDLGADSLDMMELGMAFDEAFCIKIPEEDAAKICTLQDAVDYICKHARHRVRPCPRY